MTDPETGSRREAKRLDRQLLIWGAIFVASLVLLKTRGGSEPNIEAIHAENELHARERAAAVPSGFVTPQTFPELVAALHSLTGSDSVSFVGDRDGSPPIPSRGVAFRATTDTLAKALADTLTRLIRPKGMSAFAYPDRAGIGPWYVVAMPTPDPYEAIEVVGTSGNSSPSTLEIIEWLRALEREQPFIVTDIDRSHVGGRFLTAIADPAGLAKRFNDLCPDIVRQGVGSVKNLEIELRESRYLYCWWD